MQTIKTFRSIPAAIAFDVRMGVETAQQFSQQWLEGVEMMADDYQNWLDHSDVLPALLLRSLRALLIVLLFSVIAAVWAGAWALARFWKHERTQQVIAAVVTEVGVAASHWKEDLQVCVEGVKALEDWMTV